MTTHVFIVDERTFKVHLEYLFAGTGSKDNKSRFLTNPLDTSIHHTTEKNLVGMIADVSRIRVGDNIIFYVQGSGKFYGVFQAVSTAFFDENDDDNYLINQLGKGLSFRVLIAPKEVYAKGITEHEYLDSLSGIEYPYQLCWSLIYRKLKGNRGCTMITNAEFDSLLTKLRLRNENQTLDSSLLTYNSINQQIEIGNGCNGYHGRMESINIKDRLLHKHKRYNAYEAHLQAYIMQNIDKVELRPLLLPLPESEEFWVGNEVSCGVGMQRIDVMVVQEDVENVFIKIIELKYINPYTAIVTHQLPWYIEWVCDYLVPHYNSEKRVHITPCVLAAEMENVDQTEFYNEAYNFTFDAVPNNTIIDAIEYIGFKIEGDNISFSKIF